MEIKEHAEYISKALENLNIVFCLDNADGYYLLINDIKKPCFDLHYQNCYDCLIGAIQEELVSMGVDLDIKQVDNALYYIGMSSLM